MLKSKIQKALRAIFIDGNTYRIWQILNKTDLMRIISVIKRSFNFRLLQKRQKVLQQVSLPPQVQKTLQDLQTNGYAKVDHLIPAEIMNELALYVGKKLEQVDILKNKQAVQTKDFWVRLSDDDQAQGLTTANPLVKVSLQEDILKLAGAYVQQAPYLDYVLLTYSTPKDQPLQSSQLWHTDRDNDRMLKMFIYFTDVLEDGDGPFTFFPKKPSAKIHNSFFRRHLKDDEVAKDISLNDAHQMKGRKLTAFVCDTSVCYHMGSRVSPGHHRLMLTSLYVGLPSVYPINLKPKVQIVSPLSALQQASVQAY